ncbi:hypothetical protein PU629_16495 [Pullulanibacillus sp. KACC 23026]|uniref:hypothetical protein n=1 Tax=Pullulanibacillus sp. KACC 23026 TaxID=3028315 RepID=UPI0023AEEE4D|nr:hypothetical protein [Pullulanibacillus sp. KACC 23026]WEG11725.1 hypothetical protein PU629_16495 [Pullulanibacillus sp. KACC 23026]
MGSVKKGEIVKVHFPLSEYQTIEKAMGQEYVVQWRGDDVIHISPEGNHKPLYNNRKIYDQAPMKEGTFHHPEQELIW